MSTSWSSFSPGAKTYGRFFALSELLEARLGRRVELVTVEALSPLGPRILAEAEDVLRAALLPSLHFGRGDYLLNQWAGLTAGRFMADETLRRAFILPSVTSQSP